jgi:predicted peroxiredoxin
MLAASEQEGAVKITYFVSAGTADPTRASIPLHVAANGSLEVDQDVAIVLAGDATELLLGDTVERLEGVGVPPARDLLAKLRDHAVPVYV